MNSAANSQVKAAINLTITLGQAILAAGPEGIPSGHLYAMVMAHGVDLASYQGALGVLTRSGLVKNRGDLLTIEIKS